MKTTNYIIHPGVSSYARTRLNLKQLFVSLVFTMSIFLIIGKTELFGQCTHTIYLADTYGDGWNGGAVSLSVDGVTVLNNITLGSGYGPQAFTFTASAGQTIRVWQSTAGSYASERRIYVVNGQGDFIIAPVQPATGSPTTGGHTGIGKCLVIPSGSCQYTVNLTDTYGDGSNGGVISVSVNGVTVLSNVRLYSGSGPHAATFAAESGQTIRVWLSTSGNYPNEMRFYLVRNSDSQIVITSTQPTTGGHTITACCVGTPPSQIGYTAASTGTLPTAPSCNNWSNTWCVGSGAYSELTLTNGINYTVENYTAAGGCGTLLTTAYMQAWGSGSTCGSFGPLSSVGTNSISFNANQTGNYRINVTSNNCSAASNSCGGALGHDFTGQSAVLRYRQNTTVSNTTPTTSMCVGDTRTVTATLGGAHNNPTIGWSIVSGPGSLSGTTLTATGVGTIVVRATVGYCQSDVSIPVNAANAATLTTSSTTICHGNSVTLGGNVTASGAWTLTLNNGGGSTSGTGNGSWSISVTPTGTTTYSIASLTGSGCPTLSGSTTITLPTAGTSLAQNGDVATCTVNSGETVHFYHSSGRYIASVTATGGNLGSTTATAYVDVTNQLVPACDDPSLNTAVMQRHWVITPTINNIATVRLPYTNTELTNLATASSTSSNPFDLVTDETSILLSKYSGGAFPSTTNVDDNPNNNCAIGGTTLHINSGTGTTPVTGVASLYSDFQIPGFSEFWLHGMDKVSPLPITLYGLDASCEDMGIRITWKTISEQNSDYFKIQRSRNGYEWIDVAVIESAGNSTTENQYEFVDIAQSEIYYRLIQTDFDGITKYYDPIYVSCKSDQNLLNVYPNPNSGTFNVVIKSTENLGQSALEIIDLNGKVIESRLVNITNGVNTIYIEDSELKRGTYFISVKTEEERFKPVKLTIY